MWPIIGLSVSPCIDLVWPSALIDSFLCEAPISHPSSLVRLAPFSILALTLLAYNALVDKHVLFEPPEDANVYKLRGPLDFDVGLGAFNILQ